MHSSDQSSIESTPTADDMEQFIAMVPKVIAGRGKNDVLSYATLEAAITSIKRWSLVKFADFQLTVNEKRRQCKSTSYPLIPVIIGWVMDRNNRLTNPVQPMQ